MNDSKLQLKDVNNLSKCNQFCELYKDFHKLSFENKRTVCRNAEYRYRKAHELDVSHGGIFYDVFGKDIDLLLDSNNFMKQVDLAMKKHIEKSKKLKK